MAKIGICGSHGTGKSTICHEIIASLKRQSFDVGLVPEVARGCPFPLDVNLSQGDMQKALFWLMNAQQNAELEAMTRHEHIISDRTVIDRVAYSTVFASSKITDAMLEWALTWIECFSYTFIFKTSANPSYLKADRLRNTDPKLQLAVDKALDQSLRKMNLTHHNLPAKGGAKFALSIILPSCIENE